MITKGDALKTADMATLRVAERRLDRLARAAQSDLSQIRREIKRRKRAKIDQTARQTPYF